VEWPQRAQKRCAPCQPIRLIAVPKIAASPAGIMLSAENIAGERITPLIGPLGAGTKCARP